ncbi:MAG: hypothetical protein LBD63_03270, partial [Mycoplasmataceae bacterium]|nr:hypothetical protein [Mycoplasmataceae bacterium]
MDAYWQTVEKMWGATTAKAVHWVFTAVYLSAIIVGIILVVFNIVSTTMVQMKENDKALGEALKIGLQGMVKFIVLIAVSAIAIPLLWEILFP